jgi:CRP/FNR family transcriptional regulator, cyclic AMP receptor protein
MNPDGQEQHWPMTSLVGQLPVPERSALLDAGISIRFHEEAVIVRQGDLGNDLFILLAGLVKITVATESGSNTALAVRSRGDLIGEFALIDGSPRNATAIAIGEVSALRVSHVAFGRVVKEYPGLQGMLTQYVVSKVRESTEWQAADRFWGARARLAQILYDLATAHLEADRDGVYWLPMTQAGLGELAGLGQSTAERELAKLRDEGVIDTHYRLIAIRNLPYLAEIRFSSSKARG